LRYDYLLLYIAYKNIKNVELKHKLENERLKREAKDIAATMSGNPVLGGRR
jgi:hypothetical protein